MRASSRRFIIFFVIVCLGLSLDAALYQAFGWGLAEPWQVIPGGIGLTVWGLFIFWIGNKISNFVQRNYP
jgi:hypothetical protein